MLRLPSILAVVLPALVIVLSMTMAGRAQTGPGLGFSIGGLSEDYLGRAERFGRVPFNGAAFSVTGAAGRLSYGLTVSAQREDPEETLLGFDLGLRFADGIWAVGVSQEARHWSPSVRTSLILSRNAGQIPSVYLRKTEAVATAAPILRWIGPWRGEIFVGRTEGSLPEEEATLLAMQLVLQPRRNLEVQLLRTVQLGGAGAASGADAVIDAFLGQTNEGAASGANQMAGISAAYTFETLAGPVRLYGQVVGEDEAGNLPSCLIYLAGIEARMHVFGAPTTIALETVDTRIDETENGFCGPNTAYNNDTYAYVNDGLVMGAAIDSESASTGFHVRHEFDWWSMDWSVGHYQINDAGDPDHRLSSERVSGVLATVGMEAALAGGHVSLTLAQQDFDLDTAGLSRGVRIGLGFSRAF